MIKVQIFKRCGCFTRRGMSGEYEMATMDAAEKKAKELVDMMNEEFCGKHKFELLHEGSTIKIVEKED